jgi:lipopolysaccharide biosynthesis glycosyltransferase
MINEVFFAADKNYIKHLAVAIKSLLENNARPISIKVINNGIEKEDWENLEFMVSGYGNASIVSCFFDDSVIDGVKLKYHFKKSNYYRLFIPNFADNETVIYLDADIVVNSALDVLFELDLNDFYVAAVEDLGFDNKEALFMSSTSKYFNSGVMVVNVLKWREINLSEKVISFVNENPERVDYIEQCGLNSIINGRWLELPPKYNQQSSFFEKVDNVFCFKSSEFIEAKINPCIIHYTGSSKPWHLCNKHPYKKTYWKYRNKTFYESIVSDDFSVLNIFKCYTPDFLKLFIKSFIK